MPYTLTFTVKSDAPYSEDEKTELLHEFTEFMLPLDDDIDKHSFALNVTKDGENTDELSEDDKMADAIQLLSKSASVDLRVVFKDVPSLEEDHTLEIVTD